MSETTVETVETPGLPPTSALPKKKLRPCLRFVEGEPVYDLLGEELIFPIVEGDYEFYIHMKPYLPQIWKDLVSNLGVRMQPSGSGLVNMLPSDPAPIIPFFWQHFLQMTGVRKKDGTLPTVDEQKEFIRKNPRLRIPETVVLGGYGGIRIPSVQDDKEGGADRSLIMDDFDDRDSVRTYVWLHDLETKLNYKVFLTHRFQIISEGDARLYSRATGQSQMNIRRNEMMRHENYDSLELLYQRAIGSAEGFYLGDAPCTASNREKWTKKIPLWHATNALDEHFRGVQAKNV